MPHDSPQWLKMTYVFDFTARINAPHPAPILSGSVGAGQTGGYRIEREYGVILFASKSR